LPTIAVNSFFAGWNRTFPEPDATSVSPRMFYEMAKRYDEWEGEEYAGSSARGAMKGWHKHGVCSEQLWPYQAAHEDRNLTHERSQDAANRPLGAYFRVNHKDLVALHCALAEVGVLYATAIVHEGGREVGEDGAMEKFIRKDAELRKLFERASADWVRAPNAQEPGSADHSTAQHHGDFDDDRATLLATLARITGASQEAAG
jgi:hypothetical protein